MLTRDLFAVGNLFVRLYFFNSRRSK